jgi:hypothetical protein
MLTTSHELCFIDDIYYSKMKNKRVYYIQPPPYVHTLSYKEVVNRFLASDMYKRLYPDRTGQADFFSYSSIDKFTEQEERKITSKIMYHIREFFLICARRHSTKKHRIKIGNFTRKKMKIRENNRGN